MYNFFTVVAVSLIFTITLGSGLWFIYRQYHQHTHPISNAFVSGLFIGTGLFHLLPDAIAHIKSATINYSSLIVYGLFLSSFALLLLLEYSTKHRTFSQPRSNLFSGSLVMLLLSVHSIIGGLAIGLNPQLGDKALIFIAILAHKITDSFALIINLRRSGFSKTLMTIYIVIFALMTPAGMGLALWLTTHLMAQALSLCIGIFSGLAAGTFIYIGTLEGAGRQLLTGKKLTSSLFIPLSVGLAITGIIALWA